MVEIRCRYICVAYFCLTHICGKGKGVIFSIYIYISPCYTYNGKGKCVV